MDGGPSRRAFEDALSGLWREAEERGDRYVDIRSGDLHALVGGYPGPRHRMPMCCDVMYAAVTAGDEVMKSPPKGKGASVVIRYTLPREQSPVAPVQESARSSALGTAVAADARKQGPRPRAAGAPIDRSTEPTTMTGGRVGLVGCVKKKRAHATAARDLYVSPLFAGRRSYVERTCERWFIISALHGVVHPDEVLDPYDVTLNDASSAERRRWADLVMAQLEERLGRLQGLTFEVHAGANYTDHGLVSGLQERGAGVERIAEGLPLGTQLAFYSRAGAGAVSRVPSSSASQAVDGSTDWASPADTDSLPAPGDRESDLVVVSRCLGAVTCSVRLCDWPGNLTGLDAPGLYSWWVDEAGASALSRGLELPLTAGLLYVGEAGATRRRSGKPSSNTLRMRIQQMHRFGKVLTSTFRWTLAAVLFDELGLEWRKKMALAPSSEDRLTGWMEDHLSIVACPFEDADALEELEHAVLDGLDPPFNLRHTPPSPVRARLTELRRRISRSV